MPHSIEVPAFCTRVFAGAAVVAGRFAPVALANRRLPDLDVHQLPSEKLTLPADATSATAAASRRGQQFWGLFLTNNMSSNAVTHVTVTVHSGFASSLFSWPRRVASFPATRFATRIPHGGQWYPSNLDPRIVSTFALGYDSARSVSPSSIPVGGGQQKVTISFTPRDPRFAPAAHNASAVFNILVESRVPGVTLASITNPANLNQGEMLQKPMRNRPGPYQWALFSPQLNKQYTLTAILNVPNASPHRSTTRPK